MAYQTFPCQITPNAFKAVILMGANERYVPSKATEAYPFNGMDALEKKEYLSSKRTVDNEPTEFSDDANLLNVTISCAKTHLCIVTNGNDMLHDTNLAQLIAYMLYNNFEIKESKFHSVFDLLYKQYTAERLTYEAAHSTISEHLSENLVYDVLVKAIAELGMINTEVLCHYPLSRLIGDWTLLNNEEHTFAESPSLNVNFLIYNSLTKQPLKTIEVDSWQYHKNSEVQQHFDALKDQLLAKFGLCLHRISAADTVNVETIKYLLQETL